MRELPIINCFRQGCILIFVASEGIFGARRRNWSALFVIGEFSVTNILFFVVGLLILWIIVAIPVYLVGKIVTAGKATLGDAMTATLFGPIVYVVALFVFDFFLGTSIWSATAYELALAVAFLSWIVVFKASFNTNWVLTFVLALLAILVFAAVSALFGTIIGVSIPAPFFPN